MMDGHRVKGVEDETGAWGTLGLNQPLPFSKPILGSSFMLLLSQILTLMNEFLIWLWEVLATWGNENESPGAPPPMSVRVWACASFPLVVETGVSSGRMGFVPGQALRWIAAWLCPMFYLFYFITLIFGFWAPSSRV